MKNPNWWCEMFHSKHWEKTGILRTLDRMVTYNVTCRKCGRETVKVEEKGK